MKKYLFVHLIILSAAAFLWAQEAPVAAEPAPAAAPAAEAPAPAPAPKPAAAEPAVDIEAEGTVTWGIDLGKGKMSAKTIKHGFTNEASWKVSFPLMKKASRTSTGNDVPVYGEVTLQDIELNLTSEKDKNGGNFTVGGKVKEIEAKFVFYGAYITAFDAPSFKSNYANLWDPLKKNGKFKKGSDTFKFEPGFDGYGFKIGYANEQFMDLDVGLKFGSNGNWNSGDPDPQPAETKFKYFNGRDSLDDHEVAYDIVNHIVYHGEKVDTSKLTDIVIPGQAVGTIPPLTVIPSQTLENWEDGGDTPKEGTYLFAKRGDADGKDVHSKYGAGLDFALKPLGKMLTLALTVNSTFAPAKDYKRVGGDKDTNVKLSTGAEITSEPIDALKLKLGFDGGMMYGKKFAWDMLFNTEYKWVGGGLYVASDKAKYGAGKTDMAAYVKFETKAGAKEASNLVKGLDAGVYLGFYKLTTTKKAAELPMLLKGWVSYKAAINDSSWIKPFTTIWMQNNRLANNKPGVAYDVGVTYSPAEKVELTAKWMHGKVGNNHLWKLISAPAVFDHNGRFTLALKVKY